MIVDTHNERVLLIKTRDIAQSASLRLEICWRGQSFKYFQMCDILGPRDIALFLYKQFCRNYINLSKCGEMLISKSLARRACCFE